MPYIFLLWPLSVLYWAACHLRRLWYLSGLARTRKVGIPVLCVGNLTAGGTGKSPFCIMLAEMLAGTGYKPAILSRGYKRKNPGFGPLAVSDWKKLLADVDSAGDEPFLMAGKLLGKAVVIVGTDRFRAARMAAGMGADVVLLDDGFQHWKLYRDLDIVLLDGRRPLGNGWLLPAGRLREPASALKRAGIIIATRCQDRTSCGTLERLVKKHNPDCQVFLCDHRPVRLVPAEGRGQDTPSSPASGGRTLLFSGIARPDSFEDSARQMGCNIIGHLVYGDHHSYIPKDLDTITREAKGCDMVVTTGKDAVKLPAGWAPGKPLLVLEMEMAFPNGDEKSRFYEYIKRAIKI